MSAAPKKRGSVEIDFTREAWERFERAVDVVAKSPPQHRSKTKKIREVGHPKPKRSKTKQKEGR
jgi:hypothetical protein